MGAQNNYIKAVLIINTRIADNLIALYIQKGFGSKYLQRINLSFTHHKKPFLLFF